MPTSPLAVEPSPYEICHVLPLLFFQVELLLGLKIVWPWVRWVADGSSVDQTQRSAEPVSKSRLRF